MNASDQDIENLFKQNMDEHVLEPDFDQFQDFEIRLEKMRFTQFSWKHFNVYYTVAIISCVGLTLFNTLYTVLRKPEYKEIVQVHSDSIYIEQNETKEGFVPQPAKRRNTPVSNDQGFVLQPQDDSTINHHGDSIHFIDPVKNAIFTDKSVHTSTVPKKDSIPVEKVVKKKKSIYVQKRDTIVLYDTTKVIRKK